MHIILSSYCSLLPQTHMKRHTVIYSYQYIIYFLYTWSSDGNTSFHPKNIHITSTNSPTPHPHNQPRDPWCLFLGPSEGPASRRHFSKEARSRAARSGSSFNSAHCRMMPWRTRWMEDTQGYALTQINEFLQRLEFFNGESASTMDQKYYY